MSAYVLLTAALFQRGSAESRDPDDPARPNDALPSPASVPKMVAYWLYAYSLGIALSILFLLSFVLHWQSSLRAANEDAILHGDQLHSAWAYLLDARFWFESFQNWQSEFLATAALVILSIFLRHKGSPESKPVNARNSETGSG